VISYKVNDFTSGIVIEPCHVYGYVCVDASTVWHWVKHLKIGITDITSLSYTSGPRVANRN